MAAKRIADRKNESSWLTLPELAAVLGITDTQLATYRRRFGNAHERSSPRVAIFAPDWLRLWAADQSREHGKSTDHAMRLKAAQADLAELKLEQERGRMVAIGDLMVDLGLYGGKIREGLELIGRLNVECFQIMLEKLNEANEEFSERRGCNVPETDSESASVDPPNSEEPPASSSDDS